MSGKDLAEIVEVTPASISNIVQGNSFPKPELLLKIAAALNIDVKEMFNSTKNINSETIYIKRNGNYIPIGEIKQKL